MHEKIQLKQLSKILMIQFLLMNIGFAQIDSLSTHGEYDSQLLKLKVPEAFQRSRLQLDVFPDSSWILYRGEQALEYTEALSLLGQSKIIQEALEYEKLEDKYVKAYRSRRVFSVVAAVGGISFLAFTWKKSWVYQVPGYAAIVIAMVRYMDSRKLETLALRQQYYQQALMGPAFMRQLVDEYNFRLYQYLTQAGIQFSDS